MFLMSEAADLDDACFMNLRGRISKTFNEGLFNLFCALFSRKKEIFN